MFDISFGVKNSGACGTCCCPRVSGAPGETIFLGLDFSAWAVPIGGFGLRDTFINVEKTSQAPNTSTYPVAQPVLASGEMNTPTVGTLTATGGTAPLTFSIDPMNPATSGNLAVEASGAFTYTPPNGFTGYDLAFFKVTDSLGQVDAGSFQVVVNSPPPAAQFPEPTLIQQVVVAPAKLAERDPYFVTVAVDIAPTAISGEIYRLSIKQMAMDCSGVKYHTMECVDLLVGKC